MRPGPIDLADLVADIRLTLGACLVDVVTWALGRRHGLGAWARTVLR